MGKMVTFNCALCGKESTKTAHRQKSLRGRPRYCSKYSQGTQCLECKHKAAALSSKAGGKDG